MRAGDVELQMQNIRRAGILQSLKSKALQKLLPKSTYLNHACQETEILSSGENSKSF